MSQEKVEPQERPRRNGHEVFEGGTGYLVPKHLSSDDVQDDDYDDEDV